jgi:hypothetical protein
MKVSVSLLFFSRALKVALEKCMSVLVEGSEENKIKIYSNKGK